MGERFESSGPDRRGAAARAPGRSEAAWERMTFVDADESDRWNHLEEHLLRAQAHDAKHWKYFAK